MLPKDQWLMGFAVHASKKSKDLSTRVGCAIIGPDDEVRTTGHNGLPRGLAKRQERLERPAKYLWTCHAEENAIANAALFGAQIKGCRAYVTHFPCSRCARMLIQAGIVEVVVAPGVTNMPQEEFITAGIMFQECGVIVRLLDNSDDP